MAPALPRPFQGLSHSSARSRGHPIVAVVQCDWTTVCCFGSDPPIIGWHNLWTAPNVTHSNETVNWDHFFITINYHLHSPPPLASWILHSLPALAATNSRDEPSWLVACSLWNMNWQLPAPAPAYSLEREWPRDWVSESGSLPLPQSAPVPQILPLHLSKSLTSNSCSCCQSLVIPRLMVRYSW